DGKLDCYCCARYHRIGYCLPLSSEKAARPRERIGIMNQFAFRIGSLLLLGICVTGCGRSGTTVKMAVVGTNPAPPVQDIGAVSQTFEDFKKALKAGDGVNLWEMIDKDSRDDAERKAKELQDAYNKATDEEKAEQSKNLGVDGAELAKLAGAGYLKSKR